MEESDSEPEDDDEDYLSDKDENEDATTDGTPSPIKKHESSATADGGEKAEGEDPSVQQDPVLELKIKRQARNRFYGSKLSFLFVKQQK